SFLDLVLIKNENKIISDWYHKPTFSGRFLNFHSWHPLSQKIGIIISLIDRVLLLSHPSFHQKNFDMVIKILLKNGYPLDMIFSTIKKRLHKKFEDFKDLTTNDNANIITDGKRRNKYFVIPYIPIISDRIGKFLRDVPFLRMAYRGINKLSRFIKVQKDRLPHHLLNDVVYRIECNDCDCSYVGQTGRSLITRIKEHKNHINRNTSQHSVITQHRLETFHDFNWDSVRILDKEESFNKRLISEMIHINMQNNGLNLKNDTQNLNALYAELFS
ncbi:hypothetical protein ALC62_00911, partial [Cyphomyrmex costatus]